MAVEIRVPQVGESITEGTIARWLKKDGAAVRVGEPVFELETEKATTEVAAPAVGVLRVAVAEGRTVTIGSVVGRIETDAVAPIPVAAAPVVPDEAVFSPSARQLAAERGVDPRQVVGSGRGGRVTREDVVAYLDKTPPTLASVPTPPPTPAPAVAAPTPPAPAARAAGTRERRERMSSIRQRISQRLVAAQQGAAILTTFNEADLSAVMALRTRHKEAFQKKHGVGLGMMSFFVTACVEALKAYPVVNAWIEDDEVVHHDYHDIGVAVSTERGLMVPVLRDAGTLSFAAIEKRIAELAVKAREGKIQVGDLQGGTFTITNGGTFGSLLSTPILNAPQSAILGMHTIQKRPVAVDDQVVIRPMMYLALSYDHRLIDGRDAVGFLVRVKECVESPERLLLEV